MSNPIMTSLPSYVDQQSGKLIAKAVLGAKSAKLFTLNTGVKGTKAINLLTTNVTFGDGSSCGWNATEGATLTQRNIVSGAIKVNMPFCDKDMIGKWLEYQVKVGAGQKTLPFEEDFMNGISASIADHLETAIWQGDTSSASANLNKFDGMLKILGAESSVVSAGATGVKATIDDVIAKIPAQVYKNAVIFCGSDAFRAYVTALVSANLYHYSADNTNMEIVIPGHNITLYGVDGLIGTNKVVACAKENALFYGCDLVSDSETLKLWYSEDNREFRCVCEFNAGVQVAFPDQVVLGTIA